MKGQRERMRERERERALLYLQLLFIELPNELYSDLK